VYTPRVAQKELSVDSKVDSFVGRIVPATLTIDAVIFAFEVTTSVSPTFKPFFILK